VAHRRRELEQDEEEGGIVIARGSSCFKMVKEGREAEVKD
jgi:hypothetical protein